MFVTINNVLHGMICLLRLCSYYLIVKINSRIPINSNLSRKWHMYNHDVIFEKEQFFLQSCGFRNLMSRLQVHVDLRRCSWSVKPFVLIATSVLTYCSMQVELSTLFLLLFHWGAGLISFFVVIGGLLLEVTFQSFRIFEIHVCYNASYHSTPSCSLYLILTPQV